MPLVNLIRRATEYAVGAALVLGHLALAGRRVALIEMLEPSGLLPMAALPSRARADAGSQISRASG